MCGNKFFIIAPDVPYEKLRKKLKFALFLRYQAVIYLEAIESKIDMIKL